MNIKINNFDLEQFLVKQKNKTTRENNPNFSEPCKIEQDMGSPN